MQVDEKVADKVTSVVGRISLSCQKKDDRQDIFSPFFNCSSLVESAGFCVSVFLPPLCVNSGSGVTPSGLELLCSWADYHVTPCVPLAGGKRKKQLAASLIGFLSFGESGQTRRPSGQPASGSRRTTTVTFIPWQ